MTTSLRLTDDDLGELECVHLIGNIAYVIGSPAWTRLKKLEQAGLVSIVSTQDIIGYEKTDCFELTDKGRRILRGL